MIPPFPKSLGWAAAPLALCGVLAVAAAPARPIPRQASPSNREGADRDLGAYHSAVDAYLAGDGSRSIDVLASPSWNEARLNAITRRLGEGSGDAATWSTGRLSAAVLLHSDVALKLIALGETTSHVWHVDVAARLLQQHARRLGEPARVFAERWYVTLAAVLRDHVAPGTAERLLASGRQHLPDTASVLQASGALAEFVVTDYASAGFSRAPRTYEDRMDPLTHFRRWRLGRLGEAAAWLARAAALAPGDAGLLVHLGRVEALRHRDDVALRVLAEALAAAEDDVTAYLAMLFAAGIHHGQERFEAAADLYRAAAARLPAGHVAYIGLSAVLQRLGESDESRRVLGALLARPAEATHEPLWWYLVEPPGASDRRLDALRTEVLRR